MKEFKSQKGGRYTYIDDILNLQDLALSISHIFDGCGNFVINGCNIADGKISSGYVYINGKIRTFSGSSVTSYPVYIYESNTEEKVSFVDSGDKIGRTVYSCGVSTVIPTSNDSVTGMPPQYICIQSSKNIPSIKDAFFGLYALLKNSKDASQSVNGSAYFSELLSSKNLKVYNNIDMSDDISNLNISIDSSHNACISNKSGDKIIKAVLGKDGTISIYSGSTLISSISDSLFKVTMGIEGDSGTIGNIVINGNNIYNGKVSDNGTIYINKIGLNGGTNYYRNTVIGDGKNNDILVINGEKKTSDFYTTISSASDSNDGISIKRSDLAKTDKALIKTLSWKDKGNEVISTIGYIDNTSYNFTIKNEIGDIKLDNDVSVTGKLSVNGVDVESGYMKKVNFDNEIKNKVDVSVYQKGIEDLQNNVNKSINDFEKVFLGTVLLWAGNKVPDNYALCNGQELSQTDYPELYQVIGSTFNSAVGNNGEKYKSTQSGCFRLPDLQGRFIVGKSTVDSDYSDIANGGGEKLHKLENNEMPSHTHPNKDYFFAEHTANSSDNADNVTNEIIGSGNSDHDNHYLFYYKHDTEAAGGGNAHENRPPYYTLAYIMRIK